MANNTDQAAHHRLIDMADVKFHQCVNLSKFDVEKAVSFTPPDGEFELMSYRISDGINFPFKILPNINELGRTLVQIFITIKSQFPNVPKGTRRDMHDDGRTHDATVAKLAQFALELEGQKLGVADNQNFFGDVMYLFQKDTQDAYAAAQLAGRSGSAPRRPSRANDASTAAA